MTLVWETGHEAKDKIWIVFRLTNKQPNFDLLPHRLAQHAVFYTVCQGFSSADDRSFTPVTDVALRAPCQQPYRKIYWMLEDRVALHNQRND